MLAGSCREKYVPNINLPVTGYLVVDGYINSGAGPTTFVLTRTTKLNIDSISYETKAIVSVESKLTSRGVLLPETSKRGTYSVAQLSLNPSDQYRLRILTQAGREYVSEYVTVRRTPDIDSISWRQESDGVHIYGNTHNTQEPVGYYQWKFDETWEIHSQFKTKLKATFYPDGKYSIGYIDSVTFGDDLSQYFCWKSDTSKNILVTSTEKISENRLSMYPIRFIPIHSKEIDVRYSIHVKMNSISRDKMLFLEQLKKNTEQLGSIFDAQPSDNMGNIRSVTNPSEIVIGFVDVSEEKTKRIFINKSQLIGWQYNKGCNALEDIIMPPDKLPGTDVPTQVFTFAGNSTQIEGYYSASRLCVDCRFHGSNIRPSFW